LLATWHKILCAGIDGHFGIEAVGQNVALFLLTVFATSAADCAAVGSVVVSHREIVKCGCDDTVLSVQ
jgi:ABC-type branched-subunit amino acid transport system permease subunit